MSKINIIIAKLIKHDKYVKDLCEELKSNYDLILRHVPLYSKRKRLIGEIDILAYKDDYCDVYEVKCSHRISKAKKQVNKIRRILSYQSKVRSGFFFCGESGMLVNI